MHLTAASGGEVAACLVRVPTEVVKQRMQTGQYQSLPSALRSVISGSGLFGFYRGFGITIFREIPFASIQFPLYERLKLLWGSRKGRPVDAWEAGLCGMLAGGTAAGLTTPLDVIKTRTMLSSKVGSTNDTSRRKTYLFLIERPAICDGCSDIRDDCKDSGRRRPLCRHWPPSDVDFARGRHFPRSLRTGQKHACSQGCDARYHMISMLLD